MIDVSGIVVVDAVGVCIVHQFLNLGFIYRSVSARTVCRESHASESEHGDHIPVLVVEPLVARSYVSAVCLCLKVCQERIVLERNCAGSQRCGSEPEDFQGFPAADVFVVVHSICFNLSAS